MAKSNISPGKKQRPAKPATRLVNRPAREAPRVTPAAPDQRHPLEETFTTSEIFNALAEIVRTDVRELFIAGQMRPIESLTLAQANLIGRITVVRRKGALIV